MGSARANTIYAEDGDDRVVGRAGVACAATIDCNGGDCTGTNRADIMNGSPNDGKIFFVRGQGVLRGCEIKRPSN